MTGDLIKEKDDASEAVHAHIALVKNAGNAGLY
jgi:hypothetical protein